MSKSKPGEGGHVSKGRARAVTKHTQNQIIWIGGWCFSSGVYNELNHLISYIPSHKVKLNLHGAFYWYYNTTGCKPTQNV